MATIEKLEIAKEFIGNFQNLENPTKLSIGFRLGVLLSEVDDIQNDLKTLLGNEENISIELGN